MKKHLLSGVAAAGLYIFVGGQVLAADPLEGLDWTGAYAGFNVGYGAAFNSGCYDCNDGSQLLDQKDLDLNGFVGGVQAGFNFQSGDIVYGLEADASFMNWKDIITDTDSTGSSNSAAEVNLLASVRGRLGVAMDDILIYGTGGVALADAEGSLLNSGSALDVKFNDFGAVVGGGVEWAATEQIRFRAEGLYYIFNDKQSVAAAHSGSAGENFKFKDAITARVGVSWYF